MKIYDLLTHPHLWVGVWVVGWMGGLICGSMETIWGQHEDNVETTWGQHLGPQECGDHMGTMWRQYGTWGPLGCGDHVGTTWRQCGDHGDVETTWGQHGDNMGTT